MDHAFGLEIPERIEELCDPTKVALIVYDMQVGILGQIANAANITANVPRVLAATRERDFRVYFTRHISLPNQLSGVAQLRRAKAWQRTASVAQARPAFPPNASQTQILPEVAPEGTEMVVDKLTMSCFEGTFLTIALRDCRQVAFAIVGVALEVGIEPTVRHAADLGFIPVVVADACGAGDAAAAHRSLETLAFAGDALITDTATICGLLRGAKQ
jgi:nicotinamidase-related amidase